jgi:redox-sensitive bicupin YhaK (pirin superfamily)
MTKEIKKVAHGFKAQDKHWVGNGFFAYPSLRPSKEINHLISPFIFMDYAAPLKFAAARERKGVGEHPHRGFETVTFSYQGEIEHRDSAGGGGIIKPGDVQWMTAGSGVVHDEFHSEEFARTGGMFEMVQLWVNLPSKHKMTAPRYQSIKKEKIPVVDIGSAAKARVIAGSLLNEYGPAKTFSDINIYDLQSEREDELNFSLADGSNTLLLVLRGSVNIAGKDYDQQSMIVFEQDGDTVNFKVSSDFKGLLLNGAPLNEPVVASGPFVMNTREEIRLAMEDFQNGLMGTLVAES